MAEGVEAVVLMEDNRAEAPDHEVFGGCIGEGVPVVAGVAFYSLMELGIGVAVHGKACLDAGDEEGGVVEGVVTGGDELLFGGLRGKLDIGGDGAEVRHDAEDALGLLGSIGADGVGVGCLYGLRRGCCLAGLRVEDVAGSVGEAGVFSGCYRGTAGDELLGLRYGGCHDGSDQERDGHERASTLWLLQMEE